MNKKRSVFPINFPLISYMLQSISPINWPHLHKKYKLDIFLYPRSLGIADHWDFYSKTIKCPKIEPSYPI